VTAQPYILARTMKEAHSFARGELGLAHGKYRVVTHASTIKSVRNADLYLVPGWDKRHDRFPVKGAIRWTRMNVIDASKIPSRRDLEVAYRYNRLVDMVTDGRHTTTASLDAAAVEEIARDLDGLNPPGEQLLIEPEGWEPPETLDAEQVLNLAANPDKTGAEVLDRVAVMQEMSDDLEDEEPEAKPVKRRRRRCDKCGNLHFKTDPCPDESTLAGV